MTVEMSKADAIHVMNWLGAFKTLCMDPHNGMHYLADEIDAVRKRLFDAYKPTFGSNSKKSDSTKRRFEMLPNGQVRFPTGDDYWWCDKAYVRTK